MKFIKIIIILTFLYPLNIYSAEKDCSNIDKLSTKYAKCMAELAKEKAKKTSNEVKEKIASDKNKKKLSKLKEKLKKFKNSKTGSDFLKK